MKTVNSVDKLIEHLWDTMDQDRDLGYTEADVLKEYGVTRKALAAHFVHPEYPTRVWHLVDDGDAFSAEDWNFEDRTGSQERDGVLCIQTHYDHDGVDCVWCNLFVESKWFEKGVEAIRVSACPNPKPRCIGAVVDYEHDRRFHLNVLDKEYTIVEGETVLLRTTDKEAALGFARQL